MAVNQEAINKLEKRLQMTMDLLEFLQNYKEDQPEQNKKVIAMLAGEAKLCERQLEIARVL